MSDAHTPRYASVVFDADSTLADIEGIDWLAEQRSAHVAGAIVALTHRAMNGEVPLDAVYAERIARIRPTHDELQTLGAVYVEHVIAGARELIADLHANGVRTAIVSGGIRQALLPLAAHLGIPEENVHAVALRSSQHDGVFDALDGEQPLATQDGKIQVVRALMAGGALPSPVAVTGDGSTDAATASEVTAFIAFTQVVRRPAVVAGAQAEAKDMRSLRAALFT